MGNFTIDDAFEVSIEDAGPRFGALHFVGDENQQNRHKYKNLENDEETEHVKIKTVDRGLSTLSSHSSQCSFSTISNSTQLSTQECFSASFSGSRGLSHLKKLCIYAFLLHLIEQPVQENIYKRIVGTFTALGLLLAATNSSQQSLTCWTRHPLVQKNKKVVVSSFLLLLLGLVFVFVGIGLQVSPSPAVSSAIFFVPGFLLLIPGVYHVIFIYCAVRGRHGFQFFYLPYFDK